MTLPAKPALRPAAAGPRLARKPVPVRVGKKPRFLAFGIAFPLVWLVVALYVIKIIDGFAKPQFGFVNGEFAMKPEADPALAMVKYIVMGFVAAAFVCGLLCVLGKVAGVWIGLCAVLVSTIGVVHVATSSRATEQIIVGVLTEAMLLLLAFYELKRHSDYRKRVRARDEAKAAQEYGQVPAASPGGTL